MRDLVRLMVLLDGLCGLFAIACAGFTAFCLLSFTRADRARLDMENICGGLRIFREKHQAEPTDLRVLVESGIFEKLPPDPWGDEYSLETSSRGPAIWTYGSDRAPGGTGSAADLRYECMTGLELRSGEP